MTNLEISRTLSSIADLLEIQGANPFRVRAYRNAAQFVQDQTVQMKTRVADEEDLSKLPTIGKDLAAQITELVQTGELSVLEELTKEIPASLIELMDLPGVGPKKAKRLWKELDITTVDELEKAAQAGSIADLEGFGKKSQEKILAGIQQYREHTTRVRIADADALVEPLLEHMRELKELERLEVAGSYRRRRETVGDIDLLAISSKPKAVMKRFLAYPQIQDVEMAGDTRASIRLASGLDVDLRVLEAKSYGAALVYFTGSKAHNIKLRERAQGEGLRISEYGVFKESKKKKASEDEEKDPWAGKYIAGKTEEEVYAAVDLPWIPPELREDRGEIEAAAKGKLPKLITLKDMRGDLQMHSTWSDGKNSIEEMVSACAELGYEYMAMTDHSKALAMTGGMDAKKIRRQWKEIDKVQKRHPEIRVLKSQEIDILVDGTLDQDDDVIEQLDFVVISIHSHFELPAAKQTERIIKGLSHPHVNVIGHPTGRLINKREPYEMDLEAVLAACKEYNVAVELNAHPERLDLKDTHLMRAVELGLKVLISTDAHRPEELKLMRYGIDQARRAWLTKADVLNTGSLKKLAKALELKV
jgi:DNA polymerase (family 10)